MNSRFLSLIIAAAILSSGQSFAKSDDGKGLLPEVRIGEGGSEVENDKKALTSEIMITRSENKAIESLQRMIKQGKAGSAMQGDLYYRLAELYMRRSKSGRFFDMNQNNPVVKMSPFPVPNERGLEAVKRAIAVYSRIETEYPKFKDMDSVLFNNAFAHQQIGKSTEAAAIFTRLVDKFPKSPLIADGTLALGELLYDQGKFAQALEQFLKLEKNPKSRVFSYGMYKAAWAYYNMKDADHGIKKLIQVVKTNPALKEGEVPNNRHNLRKEALRDLTVFVGESYAADKLYDFFMQVCQENEIGQSMVDLAKLYESHSRQKEMGIFLAEFIEKNPSNPQVLKAHLYLVTAYEDLKLRDKVVFHLQAASELCKANSSWRTAQKAEDAADACEKDFRRDSLDIAKKWWEIWLKNKQNVAFSDLTQKSFRLILENEDQAKPDLKTHFALAELLFQLGKLDEASQEYKFVGDRAQEPVMQHDASYGALYSIEKALDKAKVKDPARDALRKELAMNYLTKNPTGKYAQNVRFKLGHIAYEESNFPEADKWLRPIAETSKDLDLKKKSEDLILDMLNMKKDYAGLQKFSKRILTSGVASEDRKKGMTKILEESSFAEVQDFTKTADASLSARKLLDFAKEHESSPLAKDSLWQALSLLYANGRQFEAAELSLQFAKKYPDDKRTLDGLKDAAKSYAEIGQLLKAADTLKLISDLDKKNANAHLEVAADFLRLESRSKEARDIYSKLMQNMDAKNQARMITKIMLTYGNNTKNPEYLKLQDRILSLNLEPYATQLLNERAEKALLAGHKTEAFDVSRKIMGRSIPSEDKAPARLIQAQILESELATQSVKARIEKFAFVLEMKTEKLNKAQTAYLNAMSLSKEEKIVRKALAGLDRCYANYISSLQNMPMPGGLQEAERAAVKDALGKLIQPIQSKKTDNEQRLKAMVVARATDGKDRNYSELNPEATIQPAVNYPAPYMFEAYLTSRTDMALSRFTKAQAKACVRGFAVKDAKIQGILEMANNCYVSKQYDVTEKLALELAKFKETRPLGLYYLSVASDARDQKEKALWLADELLKTQAENPLVIYQKGRLMYQLEDINAAIPFFAKVVDMNMGSSEIATFAAVKSYTEKDFITSTDNFTKLNQDQVYTYNVGPLFSEAWAQRGETQKALQLIADLSVKKKDNVEILLQQAHLIESYKSSEIASAQQIYEHVGKITNKPDLKEWIGKKLIYLKGQTSPTPGKVTALEN